MSTIIYAANSVQALLGLTIAFLGLGIIGIGFAVLHRKQANRSRVLTNQLGTFLMFAGAVIVACALLSYGGTTSLTIRLSNKTIATYDCGNLGETCSRYVLLATTTSTAYDFEVSKDAYDKVSVDGCYQITYYPNKGWFGALSDAGSSYQQIDTVTQITESTACQ